MNIITMHIAEIVVPIFICVILPVSIVWIICRMLTNKDNKNAEIIIKAIESDSAIASDKLVSSLENIEKSPIKLLQLRLLRGCMFSFTGIAAAIITGVVIADSPESKFYYFTMIVSGVCLAIGIAYLVVYFVTRKSIADNN